MFLFPAIDLKNGKCVRLKCGNMDTAKIYNSNPASQAKSFQDQGFRKLHVVDLDGAFSGTSINTNAIQSILKTVNIPVQLGGGIRDMASIGNWLEKGISRIILGTVAVQDKNFVKAACKEFPGKIAVGIDAKNGEVAIEGWAKTCQLNAIELAKSYEDFGISAIIYTDINRDGILTGINWTATIEVANAISVPVIASGGLASMKDIDRILKPDCALLEGVICGRALYDGRLDPSEALAMIHHREQ